MATSLGIGFSKDIDTELAARSAAVHSKAQLHEPRVDLAIVFCSIQYDMDVALPTIKKLLGTEALIGCSTAGIIHDDAVEMRGISVLTFCTSDIKFGIGMSSRIHDQDTGRAGEELAKQCVNALGEHNRQAFLFFTDGHLENTSSLLQGIQKVLGNAFPIIGGGASDDFRFGQTFQYFDNKPLLEAAVGVLIGGALPVGIGARHGWRPLGKPRIIDKSEANIIQSIDGHRPNDLFAEYFGKEAALLDPSRQNRLALLYPLGVYVEGAHEYLLKNAVNILEDGSIVCQGDVPEGSEVHIMIGNKDFCIEAAYEAALEAKRDLKNKEARFILVLESMSRLKLLGRHAAQEIRKIRQVFGQDVPLVGMFTNGEIFPFQTLERFKKPYIQNESIIICAFS